MNTYYYLCESRREVFIRLLPPLRRFRLCISHYCFICYVLTCAAVAHAHGVVQTGKHPSFMATSAGILHEMGTVGDFLCYSINYCRLVYFVFSD
jgi:hypothetical protein